MLKYKTQEESNAALEKNFLDFFPLSDLPVDLFKRELNQYTEEQKKFATTVHFYSPRAYAYLREHMHLPHPSTIRRYDRKATCSTSNVYLLNFCVKAYFD